LDLIEVLPPGLYEMTLEEEKAKDFGADLLPGQYLVRLRRRAGGRNLGRPEVAGQAVDLDAVLEHLDAAIARGTRRPLHAAKHLDPDDAFASGHREAGWRGADVDEAIGVVDRALLSAARSTA
jgi:hypothetical protein